MHRAINILSIALIYCGTVFGAGFASGQEIFRFFSSHGMWGIFVSVFVGFLFSVLGYTVCGQAKRYNMAGGIDYFQFLFSKKVAAGLSFLCSAFLVVSFCIMIAGCGTLAQEQFGMRPLTGAALSLFLCLWIMKNRVRGLAILNTVLTPFLFLGVIVLCMLILGVQPIDICKEGTAGPAVYSGVLYISYNIMSAVAVLVPAGRIAETEHDAKLGGMLGGVLVGIPLVWMTVCLATVADAGEFQLPFFSVVCRTHIGAAPFCALILFGAMLTTAASAGVSILAKAPKTCTRGYAIFLCVMAMLFARISFDVLVGTLYTAFGFGGMLLFVQIIISIFRKRKIYGAKQNKKE